MDVTAIMEVDAFNIHARVGWMWIRKSYPHSITRPFSTWCDLSWVFYLIFLIVLFMVYFCFMLAFVLQGANKF